MSRIGGKNFDVNLGDLQVHVESCTLDITDNSKTAQTRGVPDGFVDGDVAAAGDLELDSTNFNLLIEAARSAGSFRKLPPFDTVFFAKAGDDELRIEAWRTPLAWGALSEKWRWSNIAWARWKRSPPVSPNWNSSLNTWLANSQNSTRASRS